MGRYRPFVQGTERDSYGFTVRVSHFFFGRVTNGGRPALIQAFMLHQIVNQWQGILIGQAK